MLLSNAIETMENLTRDFELEISFEEKNLRNPFFKTFSKVEINQDYQKVSKI